MLCHFVSYLVMLFDFLGLRTSNSVELDFIESCTKCVNQVLQKNPNEKYKFAMEIYDFKMQDQKYLGDFFILKILQN